MRVTRRSNGQKKELYPNRAAPLGFLMVRPLNTLMHESRCEIPPAVAGAGSNPAGILGNTTEKRLQQCAATPHV